MRKILKFFYQKLSKKQQYWLDFLFTMTKKEIKARYKRSVIGIFWAFINPLLQMLTMGFVFQFFIPIEVDNYFLFIFIGLLPWNFFSETVLKATEVFVSQRQLIAKAVFPREVLLLSVVFSNLFHTLIAFFLLLIYLFIFNSTLISNIDFSALLAVFSYLLIFTTGFSFLTATLNVKNRDTAFVIKFILSLWFYGTPVIYSLDLIPETYKLFFYFNPMTAIVEMFRALFLGTAVSDFNLYMLIFLLSSTFSFLVFLLFKKKEVYFDDYL